MILLLDIGNTHTHLGMTDGRRVRCQAEVPTSAWRQPTGPPGLNRFLGRTTPFGISLCSVVPWATRAARRWARAQGTIPVLALNHRTIRGLSLDYPRPATIGPDRLANAIAARHRWGAPVLVVDFGTAVTFDVVDARGCYVGGIIAPGLAAMTTYLHEKTALLPRIQLRPVRRLIGRSTEEAMRIGAVAGYRGLVRALIRGLRQELGARRLPVVATGGYAALIARGLPEIQRVDRDLTLEGLRLVWLGHRKRRSPADCGG
jgi:type III pantothenate kinase